MRVLVTGSTGLLAKGLEETSDASDEIIGVHLRDYPIVDSRVQHIKLDVRDQASVDAIFDRGRFDAVVHAAGIASVDSVERHPEEGRASNLQGTRNIARAAKRRGAYLVYVSTNAVFDGESAPYAEDAPTNPIHEYGRVKLACERAVAEEAGAHCVVRPILMYGWNHSVNRPNPVTWVYERLLRDEKIVLVDDVYENPLYNHQCGEALWAALRKRPSGIFHLAGADRVNRHELGRKVAEVFGLDASLIDPVDSSHFRNIAPRPKDTTFVTARMERELGVPAVSLAEGLRAMKASMGIGL
ncbi:MAG: SDR family oxidoreductase [Elusimicrobiota bacterium]